MDSFLEECKLCHREKGRGDYRESEVGSSTYSAGKEVKTGVVTCKGYYDRRRLATQ